MLEDQLNEQSSADIEMLITLTSDIVVAHVSNNSVGVNDVPSLIRNVHEALAGLSGQAAEELRPEPAVPVRSSVKKDHIICLEDGKKMKMLKRHLMTDHGLTPEDYRRRWDLPSDYPMVAPDYAETRRDLAKKIGLGRKPGEKAANKNRESSATQSGTASSATSSPNPATKPVAKDAEAAKPAVKKATRKKLTSKKATAKSSAKKTATKKTTASEPSAGERADSLASS